MTNTLEVRLKEVLSWPYQMGGGAAQPNDHASCGVSADFTLKLFASYHITDATFEKGETNVNFTPQQATHVTGQCYKDKNMTKLKITWHKGKEYILEMDIYSTVSFSASNASPNHSSSFLLYSFLVEPF